MSADQLVATPVELEVQLNDTSDYYHVGVAASVLERTSADDVVSTRRPINWADCIHPRYARASTATCTVLIYTVRQRKKEPIFFSVLLFYYLTETGEFSFVRIKERIKERISYNYVYLMHALRILRNNEIETINTSR